MLHEPSVALRGNGSCIPQPATWLLTPLPAQRSVYNYKWANIRSSNSKIQADGLVIQFEINILTAKESCWSFELFHVDGRGLGHEDNTHGSPLLSFSTVPYFHPSILLILWSTWLSRVSHRKVGGTWCPVFWTKTKTFPCSDKAAAHRKGSRNKICKAPSLALQYSYSQKTFKTLWHKVAERLWQLPEGRCCSPLSSAGSGAGADKLLSQPKVHVVTASGRCNNSGWCRRLSGCWCEISPKKGEVAPLSLLNQTWFV